MKSIDLIILIPLLWGAYKGFTKGLLMELTMLLSFILAVATGFYLMHEVMIFLKEYFDIGKTFLPLVSFMLIFIGVVLLVNLLGRLTKKLMDFTPLGNVDDLAGALLGILKWSFALSIVIWLMNNAGIHLPREYTEDTVIYPVLQAYGPKMIEYSSAILPYAKELLTQISSLFEL